MAKYEFSPIKLLVCYPYPLVYWLKMEVSSLYFQESHREECNYKRRQNYFTVHSLGITSCCHLCNISNSSKLWVLLPSQKPKQRKPIIHLTCTQTHIQQVRKWERIRKEEAVVTCLVSSTLTLESGIIQIEKARLSDFLSYCAVMYTHFSRKHQGDWVLRAWFLLWNQVFEDKPFFPLLSET